MRTIRLRVPRNKTPLTPVKNKRIHRLWEQHIAHDNADLPALEFSNPSEKLLQTVSLELEEA